MIFEVNPLKWFHKRPKFNPSEHQLVISSKLEPEPQVELPTEHETYAVKDHVVDFNKVIEQHGKPETFAAAEPVASNPVKTEESTMSVDTVLTDAGSDIKGFWTKVKADVVKAKAVWAIISSQQTRAAMIAVFNAAVTAVQASASAVEAGGTNVALDADVVTDIKTLIADAKAGDGVIVSDFKAIGIVLS